MDVRLTDLAVMHPRLLWEEIQAAAIAVLSARGVDGICSLKIDVQDVPGFGTGILDLRVPIDMDTGSDRPRASHL